MEYQVLLGVFNIHASSMIYIYIIYSHTHTHIAYAPVLMVICDADDDIDTLLIIELQQLSLYAVCFRFVQI